MPKSPSTVRTVYYYNVERHGELITLKVCANGFLYNMVRILAGTLCEVGAGRMEPDAIPGILAGCDRSKAGPTFPAKGLFLKEVQYDAPAVDRAAQLTPEPQAI